MKLTSYWLDSAQAFKPSEYDFPESADVVIIGAGFSGLSSALALAKKGAEVVVLERAELLCEASGRNGGQCNNGTAQGLAALEKTYGVDKAHAFYRSYNDAVTTVESLIQQESIDCEFSRCGKLKLAAKPAHLASLKANADLLKKVGLDPDVQLISRADLRDEIATDSFYGGLLYPDSAQMHVGKFGRGLAEAAQSKGVKLFERAAVTGLKQANGDTWLVESAKGELRAKQVLLANGGSGPGPFSWFRRRIVPVGSFAVVTEPLGDDVIKQVFPGKRNYVTTRHVGHYFRLTEDKRLLFGGRARFAVSNQKSDKESAEILRKSLTGLFPILKNLRFDYCWGGSVDMTADRLPRLGERNGLYYAMGYSGHGVQMAIHAGNLIADLMDLGENTGTRYARDQNPWHDLPWPPVPGHFGKPWFLPAVGLYYKALDAIR